MKGGVGREDIVGCGVGGEVDIWEPRGLRRGTSRTFTNYSSIYIYARFSTFSRSNVSSS